MQVCLSGKYSPMGSPKGMPKPRKTQGGHRYENNIREIRESFGLTIEQLAERAGISSSFLSRLERDGRNLSLKSIDRIARALGVERDTIIVREAGSASKSQQVPFPWHVWVKLKPENRQMVIRMIKAFPEVLEDVNDEEGNEDSYLAQPELPAPGFREAGAISPGKKNK